MDNEKYNTVMKAIDDLIAMAKNGNVLTPSLGICRNLSELCGFCCYSVVDRLAMTWEHHRNKGKDLSSSPILEDYCQGKWEGNNLIMRISLLEHIKANLHTYEEPSDD